MCRMYERQASNARKASNGKKSESDVSCDVGDGHCAIHKANAMSAGWGDIHLRRRAWKVYVCFFAAVATTCTSIGSLTPSPVCRKA